MSINNTNAEAKQQAITAITKIHITPTNIVSYKSLGFVLIICKSIQQTQQIVKHLNTKFKLHYLLQPQSKTDSAAVNITYGNLIAINGYLGEFEIKILINNKTKYLTANKEKKCFDIIIDLVNNIKLAPVTPFGYYSLSENFNNLDTFTQINQFIGIFDKPKFFNLNTLLCIHSRNKTELCQRCINFCPAEAISSEGDYVKVNPNLCHGCGTCSSVCPTGAISYAYPTIKDNAKKIYTLINTYLAYHGKKTQLLFYTEVNKKLLPPLENYILPLTSEEIGYLDLEIFLYAFCLGVENIIIHCLDEPKQTIKSLNKQIDITHKILQSLGYKHLNKFIILSTDIIQTTNNNITPLSKTIGLLNLSNKRDRIFAITDFLYKHKQTITTLSQCDFDLIDDVYFGEVIIDKKLCTLCMACASICPTQALTSGNINKPIINFQENLCVQCSLCINSCPEQAMQLNSRLIFNYEKRTQHRILNQDKPFKCVDCGKIFGSHQVIQKMIEKLKDHSMFTEGKINNLTKCENCRVKALF